MRGHAVKPAVRKAGRGGHHARPRLISRLVDRSSHRRRKPGIRLRHFRPTRSCHIPGERENDAYQYGPDCGGEPRLTAGTEEPSWSRRLMHGISPWHGTGAYHRIEATRAASSEGNYVTVSPPALLGARNIQASPLVPVASSTVTMPQGDQIIVAVEFCYDLALFGLLIH